LKQILQNLQTGETQLVDVPVPAVKDGHILIKTKTSLLSLGTEKMLIEFSSAGYIGKARRQPEKIRQVIDKIKTDGLLPTVQAVRFKLNTPLPLGYSNAGQVIGVGQGVSKFQVGDRVISNGPHAEVVCVPENLCAKIPDNVGYTNAAFTVLGAIALQGIRLAAPSLGETFVVTGLGLVGLITVQLLKANGCKVIGIDVDSQKTEIARRLGAETVDLSCGEDPLETARVISYNRGVDGVIITATTSSDEPVHQAAQMCRKKGRIVLVGVVGLKLSRADFYEKELQFQVSCSYGPGRYDEQYELKGCDYPIGYVRWTEQRNFEAVLDMLSLGKLDFTDLVSCQFTIDQALKAYRTILSKRSSLGVILTYDDAVSDQQESRTISLSEPRTEALTPKSTVIGVIGAGNYTGQILLPGLVKTHARLKTIASSGGISSTHLGKKFHFEQSTTDVNRILSDPEINAVIITTQHNTHAELIIKSLKAGKKVFVEKPLAINPDELEKIKDTIKSLKNPFLMVGFNRRFAPQIVKIKQMLERVKEPKSIIITVNAGFIPGNHWVHDLERGGGRVIGEACHFIDLLRCLIDFPIVAVQALKVGFQSGPVSEDKISFSLKFKDGSIGTVHYLANGHKSFPKERVEIFVAGKVIQLNNFIKLKAYGWPRFKKLNLWTQDKGHRACLKNFVHAVETGNPSPVPIEEAFEVTTASFEVVKIAK